MEDNIRIFHLGGQDEVGKNLTVVEINGDIFVLDCGFKLPDKSKHGIDFIIPRFDYLIENKSKIKAYILTRGNDIALAGLPFLIKRAPAPVMCTDITRIFLESFCEYAHAKVDFDFDIIEPSDVRMIAGRKIRFFPTATNTPRSNGVAISTDKGNIVFIDDFVIDNNCDNGYISNSKAMADIASEETLLLMLDSFFSERPGYTIPSFKLAPLIESSFKDAPGRIYIALESLDIYNIEMASKLAFKYGRKIIFFDEGTETLYKTVNKFYKERIPTKNIASIDDALRLPPKEVAIFITGFGTRIYHKISLFGCNEHKDKRLKLLPDDTFIMGLHASNSTELLASEAVDELYHNDVAKIIYFKKNEFLTMHPSEEDLKTMISIFRPKYYVPINGTYKQLLSNAMIAVNMNIGLTYTNIFILDNGMVLDIDQKGAFISKEKVLTGELYVDGFNIGLGDLKTMEQRRILGDDGVVVIGAVVSLETRKITYGPDIQTRGLVYVKESESLLKELERLSLNAINEELTNAQPNLKNIEEKIKDDLFKHIKRVTTKSPMIISMINKEK